MNNNEKHSQISTNEFQENANKNTINIFGNFFVLSNSKLLGQFNGNKKNEFFVNYGNEQFQLKLLNNGEILIYQNGGYKMQNFIKIKGMKIIIDKQKAKNPQIEELKKEISNNATQINGKKEPVIYWSEIADNEARGNEMINEMIEKIKLRNKIKKEMKDLYLTDIERYNTLEKKLFKLNHELKILKINAGPDDETRKYFVETIKEDMPNIDEYLELKLKEIGGEELVDVLSFKDGIDISKINQRKLKYNFFNNLSPEDQEKIHQLFRKLYKFGEDNFLFRFVESNSIDTHLDIFDTIL